MNITNKTNKNKVKINQFGIKDSFLWENEVYIVAHVDEDYICVRLTKTGVDTIEIDQETANKATVIPIKITDLAFKEI